MQKCHHDSGEVGGRGRCERSSGTFLAGHMPSVSPPLTPSPPNNHSLPLIPCLPDVLENKPAFIHCF